MSKARIIFLLLLTATYAYAQQQDTVRFTLAQCIEYAFANSYERQSMLLDVNQQEESLRGVKLQQAPSVSASLGESLSHSGDEDVSYSGNANIGINIDLMNFSLYRNIESQKLYLERVKFQNEQYDQNLVISILRNYVTVIGNMELINYQEQIVEASRQQLLQGEVKYKAGAILESDYLLLQAQYASNVTSLVDSKSTLSNSLLELKVLMSMDHPTFNAHRPYRRIHRCLQGDTYVGICVGAVKEKHARDETHREFNRHRTSGFTHSQNRIHSDHRRKCLNRHKPQRLRRLRDTIGRQFLAERGNISLNPHLRPFADTDKSAQGTAVG